MCGRSSELLLQVSCRGTLVFVSRIHAVRVFSERCSICSGGEHRLSSRMPLHVNDMCSFHVKNVWRVGRLFEVQLLLATSDGTLRAMRHPLLLHAPFAAGVMAAGMMVVSWRRR